MGDDREMTSEKEWFKQRRLFEGVSGKSYSRLRLCSKGIGQDGDGWESTQWRFDGSVRSIPLFRLREACFASRELGVEGT